MVDNCKKVWRLQNYYKLRQLSTKSQKIKACYGSNYKLKLRTVTNLLEIKAVVYEITENLKSATEPLKKKGYG
jgi:hypothetical protein